VGLARPEPFRASSARVRVVGPSELPEVDRRAVQDGTVELILQEPAGRRLEDRVLDVLRIVQVARDSGFETCHVELGGTGDRGPRRVPDRVPAPRRRRAARAWTRRLAA